MAEAEHRPVIVGVGQVNDRPEVAEAGRDPLELMEAALRLADRDAGGGWLAGLDRVATVDQISFPDLDGIAGTLAERLGATGAVCETTELPHGDSPVRLLNEAVNRIAGGEERVVAIVGAEALRTAAARARANRTRPGDILRGNPKRSVAPYRAGFGLTAPVDLYPIYENACRHAWGQSLAEGQAETGAIWSEMAAVAARTEAAWLRGGATA